MLRKNVVAFLLLCSSVTHAQFPLSGIRSSYVLQAQREKIKTGLHLVTIYQSFSLPLNKETEYRYQSAFWAISQFQLYNDTVASGFRKVANAYNDSLDYETRRSFLEAIYAVKPTGLNAQMNSIGKKEKDPKLFAMAQLWLFAMNPPLREKIITTVEKRYQQDPLNDILEELTSYLKEYSAKKEYPPIQDLFAFQSNLRQKTVYSFQQWNRDYPGIAVIQLEDGRFARNADGKLITIQQLARSGSSLPYFITNGNTPQGIFRISGLDTSSNNIIGPTPNLQMIMPNEMYWKDFFIEPTDTLLPLNAYQELLPSSWKDYFPMYESFQAGKIGRTEIIAHGTTLDPDFFSGKPFYPISPTLGCLCAKEIWDPATGQLKESEQLRLVNAFLQTPGKEGYIFVINYFNKSRPLIAADIEPIVHEFEIGLITGPVRVPIRKNAWSVNFIYSKMK